MSKIFRILINNELVHVGELESLRTLKLIVDRPYAASIFQTKSPVSMEDRYPNPRQMTRRKSSFSKKRVKEVKPIEMVG